MTVKQKELLYTGKAKSVYRTDAKGKLIVEFRDDITAFDGGKKDILAQKAVSYTHLTLPTNREV